MKISLIVAHGEEREIGINGGLPWHLPDDLRWFKKKTVNKPIVMGRTTWEGLSLKPLPRRLNLIMSRDEDLKVSGGVVCHSINDVLTIAMAKETKELMITGGSAIYKLFYPLADKLYITKVHTTVPKADTHFLDYSTKEWHQTFEEFHSSDDRHAHDFTFQVWERIIQSSE